MPEAKMTKEVACVPGYEVLSSAMPLGCLCNPIVCCCTCTCTSLRKSPNCSVPPPLPLQSFWAISRERQSYSGATTWVESPTWSPVQASLKKAHL